MEVWNWRKNTENYRLIPTYEAYYCNSLWKERAYKKVLDLGSRLGRHSIYFANNGFDVSAIELSDNGVVHLKKMVRRRSG